MLSLKSLSCFCKEEQSRSQDYRWISRTLRQRIALKTRACSSCSTYSIAYDRRQWTGQNRKSRRRKPKKRRKKKSRLRSPKRKSQRPSDPDRLSDLYIRIPMERKKLTALVFGGTGAVGRVMNTTTVGIGEGAPCKQQLGSNHMRRPKKFAGMGTSPR